MLHWTVEVPLAFEFYTDGAFRRSQNVAASGVVLIVYTYDGPRFGGYLTAWCFSDPSAPRAEVTAVTLAVPWACHLDLKLGFAYTKIGFLFDNVYAGASAQGRCASALNYDLVPIVRSLTLCLEQITFVDIVWSHVQGHSNHPWNDLADAVAYGAIANNYVATDICALVQCCCCGDNASVALQWL
jgi:ribonuclease HI